MIVQPPILQLIAHTAQHKYCTADHLPYLFSVSLH